MDERTSCVVTGGANGIGRAIVELLAASGRAVVVVDRDERALAELPAGAAGLAGDVVDPGLLEQAVERARALAPLTSWVNNAAIMDHGPLLHEISVEALRRQLDIDLYAYVLGTAAAARELVGTGRPGAIVNISSVHARRSLPGWTVYATAKAGVEGLTRGAAVEYGRYGIRVNAVAPGLIATESALASIERLPQEKRAEARRVSRAGRPILRAGEPAEVARVVAFLLDDAASLVTGAVVSVDGGEAAGGLSEYRL